MPVPTPTCNVEPMYPHFFLKDGGGGGGGGGKGGGNCKAFVKKIALF